MAWSVFPSDTIVSNTCQYTDLVTYVNVDKTMLDYLGPYYAPELYDDDGMTDTHTFYTDTVPDDHNIYLQVIVNDLGYPFPGSGKVQVTCTLANGETYTDIVSSTSFIGPISLSNLGDICKLTAVPVPVQDFSYVHDTGLDDVQVTLVLYVDGRPVATLTTVVGDQSSSFKWNLFGDDTQIPPDRVVELMNQAIPIDPSNRIYYVGEFSDVVQTGIGTSESMTTYIMFTSDIRDALSISDALLGDNVELIVVDPKSYWDYTHGYSSDLNAVALHVVKQFNDITIVPNGQSDIYSSNGEIQLIEKSQNIGDYTLTSYEAAISSQYQLDLSEIYGTPTTIETPNFKTTIKFPNCTFTTVNWTNNDTVNFDFPMPNFSMPNITMPDITMPELEVPELPPLYTIDIIRSLLDSYIWRCEEDAEFLIVVRRSDGLSLSPSSYKITSVTINPPLEYTITSLTNSSIIRIKLPQQDTTVDASITIEIDGQTYTQDWSFTVTEWGDRQLSGEVKTDKLYYDYGSSKPVEVTVVVHDLAGRTVSGLIITDNWGNTYTDSGNGNYKATIDISKLPVGQYNVFVKIDPNGQCYKSNLSDMFVTDRYVYNPLDFENQNFKLTYPLVENVTVTINGNETTNYDITLNEYGDGILHINDTLNEGDRIEVKYQAYMSSTVFYVGSSEPISSTVVDKESIAQYGRTPAVVITIPFLQSQEEANEIAEMYLKYYSKPTKIISTNNKW